MSTNNPDYFNFRKLLTATLKRSPVWQDLADACNEVLGREVEERRRRLARSRDSVKNRSGDIVSQIEYWPETGKEAEEVVSGDPVVMAPGTVIPKARITSIENNIGIYGNRNSIDYFNVEFILSNGKVAKWQMPMDAPQERSIMVNNAYSLGFDFFNTKLSNEDYQRLYEYIGNFWPENGADDNFIKFIGFIKNLKLEMEPLWSEDNGTDTITVLESLSAGMTKASEGGSWYLTSHVEVRYDVNAHNDIYDIDLDEIEKLFYLFAPIMLVLERIVGVIEVITEIYIANVVQTCVYNYGISETV